MKAYIVLKKENGKIKFRPETEPLLIFTESYFAEQFMEKTSTDEIEIVEFELPFVFPETNDEKYGNSSFCDEPNCPSCTTFGSDGHHW